jgi:hypothetical protein
LDLDGLVTHTLRKTVASFLDDADVSTRRISDQLGHAKVSMTQDRYLGRRLTDRVTADVLEDLLRHRFNDCRARSELRRYGLGTRPHGGGIRDCSGGLREIVTNALPDVTRRR